MADLDPVPDPNEPTPVSDEPEQSLAEFEAEFGGDGSARIQPDPNPEPEEDIRRPPRQRDDQGKFVKPTEEPKPKDRRPASHEAPAAEVRAGRIDTLTKNWRTAEAERDALRAEVDRLKAHAAPPAPPATVPRVTPTAAEQRDWNREVVKYKNLPGFPKTDDFQEFGDAMLAQDLFIREFQRNQDREQATKDAETARIQTNWRSRVDEAKTKYPDFEAVALQAPTRIPQGSLIDAWILEHRTGADVLYTLQSNPAELDRILSLPLFDQVEALTLLGQRTGHPPRVPAASTGAAATVRERVAPRPPTPVRVGAVPAPDEPPDPETASLDQFERYYHRDRH